MLNIQTTTNKTSMVPWGVEDLLAAREPKRAAISSLTAAQPAGLPKVSLSFLPAVETACFACPLRAYSSQPDIMK